MKSAFLSVWLSLFRNSKVTVYSLIYVTLWHMSIIAGHEALDGEVDVIKRRKEKHNPDGVAECTKMKF